MELKHCYNFRIDTGIELLIVPYGIETYIDKYVESGKVLLIVPYGIETQSQLI